MKSHIIEKCKKYLNNDSIVLGSFSYFDKLPDKIGNYFVKDFNDKTIFIIPGVSGNRKESFVVANYIFECFEQQNTNKGFEAFKDVFDDASDDEKLVSKYFNKGISLNQICYITGYD